METCSLCSPDLAPKIAESQYWTLVLNHNQRFLGACFWVLHRHIESVAELTAEEWADLHPQIIRSTRVLVQQFKPDHFNNVFLQNQDRHVHMHIFPRYAQSRIFAGSTFEDVDYPSHYSVPADPKHLQPEQYHLIAQTLRKSLAS